MKPLNNNIFYLVDRNIPYGCTKSIFHNSIHDKYSIRRISCTLISTEYSIEWYEHNILHDYFI